MTTYYTYKRDVPLRDGETLGFTSGKGYYANAAPPPPTRAPASSPPPTVPYNPYGYVPGGASPKVAIAIEAQALATPGAQAVQVPSVVVTNLLQDEITYGYVPTTTKPPSPPKVPPPAATYPQTGSLSFAELEACWLANGGADNYRELAANIALCESGGSTLQVHNTAYPDRAGYKPPAKGAGPEFSIGLWQINWFVHKQFTEESLRTSDGNAKAIIQLTGNGSKFAQTNVACYNLVTKSTPVPTAPDTPPGLSSSGEPPSVSGAWLNLLSVLGKKVPAGLDSITSNAEGLVKIFQ